MTAQVSALPGFRLLLAGALAGAAFFAAACRPFRPGLRPPSEVREIEGYASLRLTRGEETSRAKFAFAIVLTDRARLEVFDALGRSVSIFLIRGDEAYLVLPSERAYWRGERDEVIEKFLGFPIRPAEIAGLISGRWSGKASADWAFVRDEGGRIVSGTRGELSFRVLEFFSGSDLPRRWTFRYVGTEGVIGLLDAAFDRPAPDFSLDFLRPYASKTWPEIERLLR
jgi:hypothetical protein